VDELHIIAEAHQSTVARVALAWVQAQPGVTSTIIGARRLAQLEDNLKALDVKLSTEELGRLDALTKPTFGFPQSMQPWFASIHNGGTSVNGISAPHRRLWWKRATRSTDSRARIDRVHAAIPFNWSKVCRARASCERPDFRAGAQRSRFRG